MTYSYAFIPYVGFRHKFDGKSTVMQTPMRTAPGKRLSDKQIISSAANARTFLDSVSGVPTGDYIHARILSDADFPRFDERYVYKFVSESDYDAFYRHGFFRLGYLEGYRLMEDAGLAAGDRYEGTAFVVLDAPGRQCCTTMISGYDVAIMSAAASLDQAEHMRSEFGPVVLKIEVKPFANELGLALALLLPGCNPDPDIRRVQYADLKIYRAPSKPAIMTGWRRNKQLPRQLLKRFHTEGAVPSVFAKPYRFAVEDEVRLRYNLAADATGPIDLHAPHLLRWVTRV